MTLAPIFPEQDLRSWSERYDYATADLTRDVIEVGEFMRQHGYLTLEHLVRLCRWKTPRTQPRVKQNSDSFVREVTSASAASSDERFRIEVLTLLRGVSWPTASVILHFGHADPYPIIDFRALWSLGQPVPSRYTFAFWWEYVQACRALAERHGLTMREVDQALWQYSKDRQSLGNA